MLVVINRMTNLANPVDKERGLLLEKQYAANVLPDSTHQTIYLVEIVHVVNSPRKNQITANPVEQEKFPN